MNAEKYLIVKGVAGLGNRIFTLARAIHYAKESQRALLVDWQDGQIFPKDEDFFSRFFSLRGVRSISSWDEIPPINHKNCLPPLPREILSQDIYTNFRPATTPFSKYLPRRLRLRGSLARMKRYWKNENHSTNGEYGRFSDSPLHSRHITYGSDLDPSVKEQLVLFVDYCPKFQHSILTEHLELQPQIKNRLDEFSREHLLNQISFGLHYRNSDKRPTGDLTKWIRSIKEWRVKPDKIFLATDDPKVEPFLRQHFPRIVAYPKLFPQDSGHNLHHYGIRKNNKLFAVQAMEASIMDMYILSRCDYLFYQGNSTFSRVSQIYHRSPANCFDWQVFGPDSHRLRPAS